jgi:hypothetical protein
MQIEDGLSALVCDNGGVFGGASKDVERIRMSRWPRGDGSLSSTKDGGSFKGEM